MPRPLQTTRNLLRIERVKGSTGLPPRAQHPAHRSERSAPNTRRNLDPSAIAAQLRAGSAARLQDGGSVSRSANSSPQLAGLVVGTQAARRTGGQGHGSRQSPVYASKLAASRSGAGLGEQGRLIHRPLAAVARPARFSTEVGTGGKGLWVLGPRTRPPPTPAGVRHTVIVFR